MKYKAEIEWFVGVLPETASTKLIAVQDPSAAIIDTCSGFYDAGVWHYVNGRPVGSRGCKVVAWASLPTFDGAPSVESPIVQPEPAQPEPSQILTFGQAIEALKAGKKITRTGWNGKGMYLWLLPEAKVPAGWCKEPHLKALAEGNPDGSQTMHCLPSIRMKTADGKVLTGWLASQTDIFAEDWIVIP